MVTQDGSKEKISNIDNADHSVRCVYDEWYWGSAKEADRNTSVTNATAGNYYQGIDSFMMPSTRNVGFSLRLKF